MIPIIELFKVLLKIAETGLPGGVLSHASHREGNMVNRSRKKTTSIPDARQYDCRFYGKCLAEAAILDNLDMACGNCQRYEAIMDFIEEEFKLSALVRVIFEEMQEEIQ